MKPYFRPLTLSAVATVLLAASLGTAQEAYWPQFHGPNRDNLSTETGLLDEWPEGGPPLDWTASGIGYGYSTVSIAAGRVYTAGNIDEKSVVTAMEPGGKILWQADCGTAWLEPHGGTRGTPTVDGDHIYYETPLGDVVCLDSATGERVWGLNILEKFGGRNITWGLAESLLIDGDRVICSPGGPETAIVALDKRTGAVAWKSPSTGDLAGYASPILAEYQGLRMIITMTSKALIGVNADTGALLWRFEHETYADENIIRPIFHGGEVFISTMFDAGSVKLTVRVQGTAARVEEVWRSGELDNQHGGVLLHDGYLYGASRRANNAAWVCLDWKTGKKMYASRGIGKGSLTYADGMLYLLNENRDAALVQADPARHEVVSSFEIPSEEEGPTWAHPVVCGGRLYIRHGNRLFVYDVTRR